MSCPRDICDTVSDLVDEVGKHLEKTQINKQRAARDEELHLSPLISSSGSFYWITHTTCLKGKTAIEGQEAGLAIFDDQSKRCASMAFDSSRIDHWERKWAMNSDEYLCWDLVPKSALVKFLPYERLVYRSDYPDDYFLRSEFIGAASLGDFKKRFSSSLEPLIVD